MRGCEHHRVYSGRTNMSGRNFEWICSKCGEINWSETYELSQVNLEEFYEQRVLHGWAAPPRLPAPPGLPVIPQPTGRPWKSAMSLMAFLFSLCAGASVPWGDLGPLMPWPLALIGCGLALLLGTLCYVGWSQTFHR